ncbi:Pancreatic triacylglycerol lipase [Mytilus edulis]|uniref:Pancreatic triacylglycerol lipase n=1 Tax=Mytilus edulis TaxID=6550 RepID=A0A8S3TU59_MYTED|nr:Pancreatic triacylglycerol lipase [Mytilus edulis]
MDEANRLYKDLVNDYNKIIRPLHDKKTSTMVNMSFSLISIKDFDEVTGKFSVIGSLHVTWHDNRMIWNQTEYGNINSMIFGQNDVWKPNLFLGNAFDDMSAIGEDFITVRYYNNGTAIWTPLDMIITSCSVDVTHFPFDQQTCAIHFISVGTLPEEIVMNSEIDHAIITRYIEHEIWQLNETTAFASIVASHVCYDHIGCFSNNAPFMNAFGYLPLSPDHINTSFHLYTQANPSNGQLLNPNGGAGSLRSTHFGLAHKTVFIIHGYHGTENNPWIPLMKDPLLKFDVNVIVVIWTRGAFDSYNQAVANTRVVGAVTANMVKLLHSAGGVSYNDVHIVGHSLGAHVAGYVGETVPIGRITGLDPAGPEFNTADQRVRLDPADAAFVDIIHTDGEIAPFYSCGHMRSVYYFIESIDTKCHFTSHPCDSQDDYKHSLSVPDVGVVV